MSDFIGVDVQGLAQLQKLLRELPDEVRDTAIDEVSTYLTNVLRAYPPQKYVSRKSAYGVTFFSDKQRRWFFAALGNGSLRIPYRRTQTLSKNWKQVGKGFGSFLANETPYADYVMGAGQSRHEAAVGWKQLDFIIEERGPRIEEVAEGAAKKAIKKLGG